jgi:hypothetical protein
VGHRDAETANCRSPAQHGGILSDAIQSPGHMCALSHDGLGRR